MFRSSLVTEDGERFISISTLARNLDRKYVTVRYHVDRLAQLQVIELIPDEFDRRRTLLTLEDADKVREFVTRKKGS